MISQLTQNRPRRVSTEWGASGSTRHWGARHRSCPVRELRSALFGDGGKCESRLVSIWSTIGRDTGISGSLNRKRSRCTVISVCVRRIWEWLTVTVRRWGTIPGTMSLTIPIPWDYTTVCIIVSRPIDGPRFRDRSPFIPSPEKPSNHEYNYYAKDSEQDSQCQRNARFRMRSLR